MSIPLAFSNINKGTVKAAKFRISQSEIQEKDIEQQIQAEIMQAWFNYEAEKKKVVQFKSGMLGDAQKVMDGWYINTNVVKPIILDVLSPNVPIMKCSKNILKQ